MQRILLVDDDAVSCEAATAILQDLECAVEIVTDGGTALERLRESLPDAVLVGLNIPDMAGGVTPRAAVDAIRLGARGCIRKPVDMGSVVAALQPLLQDHHAGENRNQPFTLHNQRRDPNDVASTSSWLSRSTCDRQLLPSAASLVFFT